MIVVWKRNVNLSLTATVVLIVMSLPRSCDSDVNEFHVQLYLTIADHGKVGITNIKGQLLL